MIIIIDDMVMCWSEKDGECVGGLSASEEYQNTLFDSVSSESNAVSGFQSSKHVSLRIRLTTDLNDQEIEVTSSEENSPLGLTLKKTPSFLNLIEMKLAKSTNTIINHELDQNSAQARMNAFISQPMSEKLKASNFAAMLLKIGTWERISKHEGDLVAKCYYAKRKLVWEVLEGALKSKIEIQWSDISAIRATIEFDQPGILEIELNQPPLFFQETNPQPRKHTLWQQASDFTGGQAPIFRRHYVKFPPNSLDKHYEKLLQCDPRLLALSQKPFPTSESPYFYSNMFGIGGFSFNINGCGPEFPPGLHYPFPTIPSPSLLPSHHVHNFKPTLHPLAVNRQPLAVMDSNSSLSDDNVHRHAYGNQSTVFRGQGGNNTVNVLSRGDQIQGLSSVSSAAQANQAFSTQAYNVWEEAERANPNTEVLTNIENHLLGDSQVVCSDERTLLARVRSMNSLMEPFEEENFGNDMAAYQMQQQYKQGLIIDHSMFTSEHHQKVDGGLFLPQPIRCLPAQDCNENPMMHMPCYDSSLPYVYPDQMAEDFVPVDAANEVRRWT
ncbi:uncharacterized protein LOC132294545 isoform X2 [Cornus florida]|uniref:uncharacterized protein LOC132294545 isoform X2 n=1 Tax=Cornus florida TaxID=4283 RepID=UPI00289FC8F6|nr:uncharacterized protein LOC132294545 isoform X2 [Cornus florida]